MARPPVQRCRREAVERALCGIVERRDAVAVRPPAQPACADPLASGCCARRYHSGRAQRFFVALPFCWARPCAGTLNASGAGASREHEMRAAVLCARGCVHINYSQCPVGVEAPAVEDCKRRPQGADRFLSAAARQPHRRLGLVHAQPVRGVLHRDGQAPLFMGPLSAPPEAMPRRGS